MKIFANCVKRTIVHSVTVYVLSNSSTQIVARSIFCCKSCLDRDVLSITALASLED